jgi:hypothetical protein
MRMTCLVAALLCPAVALAAPAEEKDVPAKPLNILFVGNSYTQVNSLDRLVQALLESQGRKVRIGGYLMGGMALRDHWNHNAGTLSQDDSRDEKRAKAADARKGQLDALLAEKGPWDYVVLQGQSRDTLDGQRWQFDKYARLLAEKIHQANPGAKVMFYLTWARQHLPQEQATITKAYLAAARDTKSLVAPVGEAWREALSARPGLRLHQDDKSHPTVAGSYLAGCVFYAAITGQSPLGLPGRIEIIRTGKDGTPLYDLSPQDARFLQEIAWKTVQRLKDGT